MNVQMKFQKITCFVTIIISAFFFLMALGILTDIYYTKFLADYGLEVTLFDDMQPFNRTLVNLAIVAIIAAVFLLVTVTHNRRRYYISNYVATILSSVVNLGVAIYSIINILGFKKEFLAIDFAKWQEIHQTIDKIKYTKSTFWLDINLIAACLLIGTSILLIANLIWKITLMKKEDKLLSSSENIKKADIAREE